MVRALVAVAVALGLSACARRAEPQLQVVRLHATVTPALVEVATQALRQRGIAALVRAPGPAEADLFWLSDPEGVVALGARVAENGAPAAPGVAEVFQDPRRRFAPVCARAAVLVVGAGAPFAIEGLRDLGDPRLAGRVAVPPFSDEDRVALAAALAARDGEAQTSRLLSAIARNRPILATGEGDVRARVAAGEAVLGLATTEAAAAGAASAAGLAVVYPDQAGRGAVVLPTAVAPAVGSPAAALAAATWLASEEAEPLLVARVPGLMPLRQGVPVPVGVRPAGALRVTTVDWDVFAEKKQRARVALAKWPDGWAR